LPVAATAPRALAGFDGATSHPPPGERPAADAFVSLAAPMRRARIQSALRVDYEAALGGGRAFGLFFTERAVGGAYLRAGVGARLDASVDDSELLADVVGAYPLSFARGLLSVAPELGARVSLSEPARSGGRVGARVTFEAAWLLVGGQVHYELSSTAQDWWFGGFVGLVVGARGGGPQ
jgi:hypothetical protein